MKRFVIVLSALVLGGTAMAVAMGKIDGMGKSHCWRYKMTIEINTPEGVKSGSAVREACLTPFQGYNPQVADFKEKVIGEAVVVDLGERGVLFASSHPSTMIFDVARSIGGPRLFTQEGLEYYSNLEIGTKAPLPEKQYPTLVIFKDLSNPKTIDIVLGTIFDSEKKKYMPVNNFSKYFGDGVGLKNIIIEVTNEPIQWRVRDILPWLDNYYDKQLDGSRHNFSGAKNPIANRFGAGSFSSPRDKQK
ncbi:MAG: hypothetical protein R3E13_09720 [Alphaproteobacteria bacterium]